MKKAVFLASLAVMTASVFGMDNTLPADYDQSTSSVPVKHEDSKEEAKKNGEDLKSGTKKLKEVIKQDVDIRKNFFAPSLNVLDRKKAQSDFSFELFATIRKKTKPVEDTRSKFSSEFLSEVIMDTNVIDSNNVLKFLLLYGHKVPASSNEINEIYKSVFEDAVIFCKANMTEWPLHKACHEGSANVVRYLVDHGADVNKEDSLGMTPLFYACKSQKLDLVKYLVEEKGVDINKENQYGETSLFDVCRSGNLDLTKYLIERGASVNANNRKGETPLFAACESGNLDLVKYLVEEQGADINRENNKGETPLFAACEFGKLDLVKYLVETYGADVNKENKNGETPLFSVCKSGNLDLVKYLVETYRADVNKVEKVFMQTPLFSACESGNLRLVKYLVEHGADVNQVNASRHTPLNIARDRKHNNISNYLSGKGAVIGSGETDDVSIEELLKRMGMIPV